MHFLEKSTYVVLHSKRGNEAFLDKSKCLPSMFPIATSFLVSDRLVSDRLG